MNTNTQILYNDFTASGTFLTGVFRVNLYDSFSSFFRFEGESDNKGIPCRVCDRLGEMTIFEKAVGVKILNSDKVIILHKLTSDLMSRIFSLVGNTLVGAFKVSDSLTSAVRAFLSSRYSTLLNLEFALRLTKKLRRFKEFTVGCGDKVANAHVQTDNGAGFLKRFCFNFAGEAGIVFTGLSSDSDGLYTALHLPVPLDFEFAYMLDIDLSVISDLRSISIGELNRLPSVTPFESWVSGLFARLRASEESLECLIESSERALYGTEVDFLIVFVSLPLLFVCGRLVTIRDRFLVFFIQGFALVKCIVIDTAVCLKHFFNCFRLLSCRIYSVFECFEHLDSLLGFDVFADRFRGYVASSANVVAPSPERRQAAFELWKFFSKLVAGKPFYSVHDLFRSEVWRKRDKQMHMIWSNSQIKDFPAKLLNFLREKLYESIAYVSAQDRSAVFGTPHEMIVDVVSTVPCSFCHSNLIIS